MEQVLAEMIAEGEIHRHLKKSIKVYHERRDLFTGLLTQLFGDVLKFQQPSGGLAVWTEWQQPVNLMQLSHACEKDQLFIPKT
ncbi:hypothetical protein ACJBWC_10335, partial [Streptococcus suis]